MVKYSKLNGRLITDVYSDSEIKLLKDNLLMLAGDIEDALDECGAKPNKDYTFSQLFDWAVQLQSSVILAEAMGKLGLRDANTPMGALELLAYEIKTGASNIADALVSNDEI